MISVISQIARKLKISEFYVGELLLENWSLEKNKYSLYCICLVALFLISHFCYYQ